MEKFNLWKYDPQARNIPTGGWVYHGEVSGLNENHVIAMAAIKLKTKKMFLKVYPHIDSMLNVKTGEK